MRTIPIHPKRIRCWAAAVLILGPSAWAKVTFVGNDLTTDAQWRTPGTAKPNDLDGDNVYGSAGYYLAAGKRASYVDPFLASGNVITGNPDGLGNLPAFLISLAYMDAAERGRSWGGSGGNFGTLDSVSGSTGLTGAAILRRAVTPDPMSLTLKRASSPAFRLTLILGNNPNEGGFDDPSGQVVTVDDGSGAVSEVSGDPNLTKIAGYTTYQSWDLSAGSSDITLVLQGLPEGLGIARLSGIAIDVLEVVPPTILDPPMGGTYLRDVPLTLTVTAGGTKPSFQWFKDGAAMPGATAASLAFARLAPADAGAYHVVVSNSAGSVTSATAPVVVADALPTRLANYQAAVKKETSLVSLYSFDVLDARDTKGTNPGTLEGQTPFGEGIGGGAAKALVLGGGGHVNVGQVETFDFAAGTGTIEAWLRADWSASPGYNPTIFADRDSGPVNWSIHMMAPKTQIAHWNGSAVATVNLPNASSQWHHFAMTFEPSADGMSTVWSVYWDGQFAGSAEQMFGFAPESPTQLGSASAAGQERWVGALDEVAFYGDALSAGAVQAHYAAFAAGEPPVIAAPPQGGSFFAGAELRLAVTAQGVGLTYQWFKNGAVVAGATGATLAFTALAASDSGSYRVRVSNPAGSVDSAETAVSVVVPDPGAYQAAVRQEAGLISYYTFDAQDASDGKASNHGTLEGETGFGPGLGGGSNKALALTGTGFVGLWYLEAFDFTDGTGSVEAWVRADWLSSPGYNPTIFADRDGGPVNWSIHMMAPKTQIAHWNGSAVAVANIPDAALNWHHLALTFEGTTWSVYWDGELAGTTTQPFGVAPESPTQLGSASSSGQEQWVGALDEVAFYGEPLAASAIRSHYQAMVGTPVAPPTLSIAHAGNQVTISWPPEVSGFNLEWADQLPAASWTVVPGVVNNRVTITPTGGSTFFRLRKP